jgi:GNAT superfamily N-acetyltransferase
MKLPILKPTESVTPADLVRLAQHAEEQYFRTLGDPASLDFGLAILSDEFPALPEANQVRDITLPPGLDPEEALRQVEATFATRKQTCRQWYFAGGVAPPALVEALTLRGCKTHAGHLWVLEHARDLGSRTDLMVIPARAALPRLADLAEAAEAQGGHHDPHVLVQYREAAVRHLDDIIVDGLLAFENTEPVGTLNLVLAGEIGLVMDFYVRPDKLGRRIGSTLLERAGELAARSRLARLCLFCDDNNVPAKALYAKAGFVEVAAVSRMTQGA